MSWTHVGGTGSGGAGSQASLTATRAGVTAGNMLVIGTSVNDASVTSLSAVTDSQGNTYQRATAGDLNGGLNARNAIWYAIAGSSSSDTVTLTPASASFMAMTLDEYSFGSGVILLSSVNSNVGTSTAPSAGNVSVGSSDLTVGVMGADAAAGGFTAGTGFSLRFTSDFTGGAHYGIAAEDAVNNATNPTSVAFSITNSIAWTIAGADFTVAAATNWNHRQGAGSCTSSGTSLARAFPTSVVAGNLLVVGLHVVNSGVSVSIADTQGNTYTQAVTTTASGHTVQVWTAPVTTGGANTVTVTLGSSTFAECSIDEYSYTGGATFSLDNTNASSGTSTTASPGSVTVSGTDLIYSVAGRLDTTGIGYTASSGYSLRWNQFLSSGIAYGFVAQDCLGATTNQTPSFSLTASATWVAAAISVKANTTGAGGPFPWFIDPSMSGGFCEGGF